MQPSESAFSTLSTESLLAARARLAWSASRDRLSGYRPYAKQRRFHAAGAGHKARLLLGANQSGKSFCGAAETALHLTGRYPPWWEGRRFPGPVRAWAGSDSAKNTRDGCQKYLVGPPEQEELWGTGLVPGRFLEVAGRGVVPNAIETIRVRHAAGGWSALTFKSYDQGRRRWQGETLDFVWLDEEPPLEIYTEAVTRTNATRGIVYLTMTPLEGMSAAVAHLIGERRIEDLAAA